MVQCISCGLQNHAICVNFAAQQYPKGYVCKKCSSFEKYNNHYVKNILTARALPACQLGNFIENSVNCFLEQNDFKELALKEENSSFNLGKIVVRVVFSQEKKFCPLKNFSSWKGSFSSSKIESNPNEQAINGPYDLKDKSFTYKVKNIFVFQEIDGKDVSIFAMLVHEYGNDCPEPNKNRVYISYIDSVKYFKPSKLRTSFYHHIIISYLTYCKKIGFQYAHIWSCPPGEQDDYIFFRHPLEQKVPKVKMLCNWYLDMISKAKESNIIESSCDLASYLKEVQCSDIRQIPYFEGDFWPNVIEQSIKEVINSKVFPKITFSLKIQL